MLSAEKKHLDKLCMTKIVHFLISSIRKRSYTVGKWRFSPKRLSWCSCTTNIRFYQSASQWYQEWAKTKVSYNSRPTPFRWVLCDEDIDYYVHHNQQKWPTLYTNFFHIRPENGITASVYIYSTYKNKNKTKVKLQNFRRALNSCKISLSCIKWYAVGCLSWIICRSHSEMSWDVYIDMPPFVFVLSVVKQ